MRVLSHGDKRLFNAAKGLTFKRGSESCQGIDLHGEDDINPRSSLTAARMPPGDFLGVWQYAVIIFRGLERSQVVSFFRYLACWPGHRGGTCEGRRSPDHVRGLERNQASPRPGELAGF